MNCKCGLLGFPLPAPQSPVQQIRCLFQCRRKQGEGMSLARASQPSPWAVGGPAHFHQAPPEKASLKGLGSLEGGGYHTTAPKGKGLRGLQAPLMTWDGRERCERERKIRSADNARVLKRSTRLQT